MEDIATPERELEQQIGKRIKDRRDALRLTQGMLAERMRNLGYEGWQQTTISKVEQAERPLRLNEMADLARALGTSAIRLLEPEPFNLEVTEASENLRRAKERTSVMEWRVTELERQLKQALADADAAHEQEESAAEAFNAAYAAYREVAIGG